MFFLKEQYFSNIKNPESLLEWMNCIEYGWIDKNNKKHKSYNEEDDFWSNYRLLLPSEVFSKKIGTCWEQTIFEKLVFDKKFKIPSFMIFIQQYNVSTHSFLAFLNDGQWYHFENSFKMFRGIHGPYKNLKDLIKSVCLKMKKYKSGETGFSYSIMKPNNFKKKLTCKQFLDSCGYNYKKMEETNRFSSFNKINLYKKSQREEFWVIDGKAIFCDAEICDKNHESIVREYILSNHNLDEDSYQGISDEDFNNANFTNEELDVLSRRIDAREYGVKHLDWIKVNGKDVQVFGLSESKLRDIYYILYEVYGDALEERSYYFNIFDDKTNKYFKNIPYEELGSMTVMDLMKFRK